MPFFQRHLDWLVVGAAGDEQLATLLTVLERCRPEQVLWSGSTNGTRGARQLQASLGQSNIPIQFAQVGQVLDLGSGAIPRVLASGSRGAVLILEWGSFRALLPVGIDLESLRSLQADGSFRLVSALLLADSGYAPTNPTQVDPKAQPAGGTAQRCTGRPRRPPRS